MAKILADLSLRDILPSSIAGDRQVQSMIDALDPDLREVTRDTIEALIILRIDELPETVLDLLAWQWHVDFYEPTEISIERKRALVKGSIAWHKKKGTPWAVKKILSDLGLETRIYEWFDIGTAPHTFAIEATYRGDPARVRDFLGDDTEGLLRQAVEVAKPVRSHLLYLVVLPSYPDDGEEHWCVYGWCAYGHGYLGDERSHLGPVGGVAESSGPGALCGRDYTSLSAAYSRGQMYGAARYGETVYFAKLAFSERERLTLRADREHIPKASRPWRSIRPRNGVWRFGGSWEDNPFPLGVRADAWEAAKSCAAYGHSSYGGLAYMGPRYWKVEISGRYGYASYGQSGIDEPRWEPIYEFHVESGDLALDLSGVTPGAFLGAVERIDAAFSLPPLSPDFDDVWTEADLNIWRTDKSWVESGNWVRHFTVSGDDLRVVFEGISESSPAEWSETRGEIAGYAGNAPLLTCAWTNRIMNTWQPGKNWLQAGTWLKDSED